MLWQKESNQPNAMFTNLSSGVNLNTEFAKLMSNTNHPNRPTTKSNELAVYYRKAGNDEFLADKWSVAVECYNQSLLFAENGTEDVSLAYANRSACFFYLKKYDKCLVDIQLAMDANYPAKLMPKLQKRKEDCIKRSSDPLNELDPKLSFEPDTRFPCIANALQLTHNKEFGRHFVSTCDINVGETILMEDMYVMGALRENTMKCSICYKEEVNLVPCTNCINALFCNTDCSTNGIHDIECGTEIMSEDQFDPTVFNTFRSVLVGINIFRDVDELMRFVQKCVSKKGNEIPASLTDVKEKYQAFLQLSMDGNLKNCKSKDTIHVVFKLLLQNTKINQTFSAINHRRFLMHLIGHHLCVIERNLKPVSTFDIGKNYYVCILASYINHSCSPNVIFTDNNNLCVCKAVRPIQKGEQLFVHYYQHETTTPFESSKSQLLKQFGFKCKCEQCNCRQISAIDRQMINTDPLWLILKDENPFTAILGSNKVHSQKIKDMCEQFLQKYGRTIWSSELCYVVGLYSGL